MINWKVIIIRFVLTIIFAMLINRIIEDFGSFIIITIATLITGYISKSSSANGAIHGA